MYLVAKGLICRHFFSVMLHSNKAMFHIGLIPARWYNSNAMIFDPQKEAAITICGNKNVSNSDEFIYEHQIETNFDTLNKICHIQVFSETVKQNLSHKAKYNKGFGYAKKAINLALEMGCEDELNELLQRWIRDKEKENKKVSDKENLLNINNPYKTRTKGAPKKRLKSAVEDVTSKYINKKGKGR